MATLAKLAANHETLPERTMLMHEYWAASGFPSISKMRKQRLVGSKRKHGVLKTEKRRRVRKNACKKQLAAVEDAYELDVQTDGSISVDVSSDS